MHGLDKGLTMLHNKPLIQHVIERVRPQVGQLIISANRNNLTYRQFGFPVINDRDTGHFGPLSGIHSALLEITTDYALVVPCDTPFLPPDLTTQLAQRMGQHKASVAYAADSSHAHYTIMLLDSQLKENITDYLASGERRVGRWLHQQKHVEVTFKGAEAGFKNFNFVEELSQFNQLPESELKH